MRAFRWLGWVAVAVLTFLLWPARFGGSTTFVVVRGTSMEPTYHTGDVVIARKEDRYRAGEIVVYRLPAGAGAGALIVHRLQSIGLDGSIITQGDNRATPDSFSLHLGDIVGAPAVTVPNGGRMLAVVSTWWFLALTAGLAVGWRLWPDSNERSNDPPKRDDVPASQSGSRVVRGSGPGASVGRDGARTLISGEEDGPQAVAAAMILCSRTEQS